MLSSSRALTGAISLVAFVAAGVLASHHGPVPGRRLPPAAVVSRPRRPPLRSPSGRRTRSPSSSRCPRCHFEAGQRELELGHLETAKAEFNRALEVLLESPFGGRTEPRIRDHFDRLVERISAYEVTALAQGDGFAEQQLRVGDHRRDPGDLHVRDPGADGGNDAGGHRGPAGDRPRHRHPAERQGVVVRAAVHRPPEGVPGRGAEPRRAVPADDPGRLPGRRTAARSRLRSAHRERVQADAPCRAPRPGASGSSCAAPALENGLTHDWYIDERAEPEKATRAAAKYLKTLNEMFDGDWHLALASYNGGPGRVQRAMKRSGRTDFWKLTRDDPVPAARDARLRAAHPGGHHHRQEPGPVRDERPAVRTAADRNGDAFDRRRSPPHRRVARHAGADDPGPEPRAAPLDDAGPRHRLRAEGADRDRRHRARAPRSEPTPTNWRRSTGTR